MVVVVLVARVGNSRRECIGILQARTGEPPCAQNFLMKMVMIDDAVGVDDDDDDADDDNDVHNTHA